MIERPLKASASKTRRGAPERRLSAAPAFELTASQKSDLDILARLALAAAMTGRGERALPIFVALEEVFPKSAMATIGFALLDTYAGRHERAIARLKRDGVRAEQSTPSIQLLLAMILRSAKRGAEAERLLRKIQPQLDAETRAASIVLSEILGADLEGA